VDSHAGFSALTESLELKARFEAKPQRPLHLRLTLSDTIPAVFYRHVDDRRLPSVAAALDSFETTGLIDQKSRVKGLNRHEDIRENSSVRNSIAPIDQAVPRLARQYGRNQYFFHNPLGMPDIN
jgi:hypothetical protein